MRLIALKPLESTSGGPAYEITIDEARGIRNVTVQVIHLRTFDNGWNLFLVDGLSLEANMILANRDGEVSIAGAIRPPFTLTPRAIAAGKPPC